MRHEILLFRNFRRAFLRALRSQEVGGWWLVRETLDAREQFPLILEPAIRFVERRRERVERIGDGVFVGGEQRLLAHERDLLAQAAEFRVDDLEPIRSTRS